MPAASVAVQRAGSRTAALPPADSPGRDEAASSATPKGVPTTATPPDRGMGVPSSAAAQSAPAATTPPVPATTPPVPGTRGSAAASDRMPGSTPSPLPADRASTPEKDAPTRPLLRREGGGTPRVRAERPRVQRAARPPSIPAPPTPSPARGSRPARTFARRLVDAVRRGRGRSEPAAELPAVGVGSSTGAAPQGAAATSSIALTPRLWISAAHDPQPSGDQPAAPPSPAPAAEAEQPGAARSSAPPTSTQPAGGPPQAPGSSAGTTLTLPVQRARGTSTDSSPQPVDGAGQPAASAADRAAPAPAAGTAPEPTPRSAPSTATEPKAPARMRLSRVNRGSAAGSAGMPTTRTAAEPSDAGESAPAAGSDRERAQPAGSAGAAVGSQDRGAAPTATPKRAAPAEPGSTPPARLGHTHRGGSDAGRRSTRPPRTTTHAAAEPWRAAEAASAQPGPAASTPRPRLSVERRAGTEPMPAAPVPRASALQRARQATPPQQPPESTTPARLSAIATPARRSDRSAAPTPRTERPVATLARRSHGEPSPAKISRQTATAVARDDTGRAGRSRPSELARRIADALSGRRPAGTPAPATPAIGRTSEAAPHQPVSTATPAPGRAADPRPAPHTSPRPVVALAPRREPRAERELARRPAPAELRVMAVARRRCRPGAARSRTPSLGWASQPARGAGPTRGASSWPPIEGRRAAGTRAPTR